MTTTPTTQPSVRAETSYQDDLANRLGRMADEYYQSGLLAFTKGEWISARSYFDLVRELEPENPRAYLALTMVSTQRSEFATGWMFILKAVALSKNADELRIDISRFFTNPDGFRKTREAVNNAAQKYPDFASAAGLLAYYSFLNGDVGTASDAAANAEKNTPEDFAEPIKKFRSMLLEARTSAASRPAK